LRCALKQFAVTLIDGDLDLFACRCIVRDRRATGELGENRSSQRHASRELERQRVGIRGVALEARQAKSSRVFCGLSQEAQRRTRVAGLRCERTSIVTRSSPTVWDMRNVSIHVVEGGSRFCVFVTSLVECERESELGVRSVRCPTESFVKARRLSKERKRRFRPSFCQRQACQDSLGERSLQRNDGILPREGKRHSPGTIALLPKALRFQCPRWRA
jgi:hypothetical protein